MTLIRGNLIMSRSDRKIFLIIPLIVIILVDLIILLSSGILRKKEFKFTPRKRQSLVISDLDLCSSKNIDLVRDGQETDVPGLYYEIKHGSGTVENVSVGTMMEGEQKGKAVIDILIKVNEEHRSFDAYKETVFDLGNTGSEQKVLQEGDEITFDYYTDRHGISSMINLKVTRDQARIDNENNAEMLKAEQEFKARNEAQKQYTIHSIVAIDILLAVVTVILLIFIYKVMSGNLGSIAKRSVIAAGIVVSAALIAALSVLPYIPARGTVDRHMNTRPSATLENLDPDFPDKIGAPEITYGPITVSYRLKYNAFGKEYTTDLYRSFNYKPDSDIKDYLPLEDGDTVRIYYNPVFPKIVKANIWK